METPPSTRSVKISDDERGGWSSDRPRPTGGPPREQDVTTRCRVLTPTDRMRYSPGSLVVVVSGSADVRDRFVDRVIEDRGAVLSSAKVRGLLAGRVADDEIDAKASELLSAAVMKRLDAGESVVFPTDGPTADERAPFVRAASKLRRPRHMIFLEAARDQVGDEDLPALNALRRAVDTGELGQEGFQTALRLGGGSIVELKRIVFRPPPREDD